MADDDLEPLITRCPGCSTRFRVTEEQLRKASGRVRCGRCYLVFLGTDHLILSDDDAVIEGDPLATLDALLSELNTVDAEPAVVTGADDDEPRADGADQSTGVDAADELANEAGSDEEPAPLDSGDPLDQLIDEAFAELRVEDEAPVEARELDQPPGQADIEEALTASLDDVPSERRDLEPEPEPEPDLEVEPESELAPETEPSLTAGLPANGAGDLPSIEIPDLSPRAELEAELQRTGSPTGTGMRRWLLLAFVAGLLVLPPTVFWWQFDTWSRDPGLRPYYQAACDMLGCRLPQLRSLADLRSRSMTVRSHPELDGQLRVDALIVNQAPFAQPFPVIELRFSAMDGTLLASNRFAPGDYLHGDLRRAREMASQAQVRIALEVPDPGPDAVNYQMLFR